MDYYGLMVHHELDEEHILITSVTNVLHTDAWPGPFGVTF